MPSTCRQCGERLPPPPSIFSGEVQSLYCSACKRNSKPLLNQKNAQKLSDMEVIYDSKYILVTTTPSIDGYSISEYLGIESVEFVIGTGLFSEVSSSIADFFGVRSSSFEKKLQEAKQHAFDKLKYIAAEKGAHAVVAIDLDYTEFSDNRIGLIINGTLVKVTKNDPE